MAIAVKSDLKQTYRFIPKAGKLIQLSDFGKTLLNSLTRCQEYTFSVFKCKRHFTAQKLIFDQSVKEKQRSRSALIEDSHIYDYIREEVADRLADRLNDILRKFDIALDIGCGRGHLSQFIKSDTIGAFCQLDSSSEVLKQIKSSPEVLTHNINCREHRLPFRPNTLDLVISSMSLHWINDLPDLLKQILTCLRNDGCLLGVMPAMDTLYELRVSLQLAELERLGGISCHISPFVDSVDMADLLQCAGFNLITLDVDEIVIHYPNMFALMNDLRFMGESNATVHRPLRLNRDVLIAASAIYNEKFSVPRVDNETERCIPATYKLLFFIGWKPDPSQSKPLPRGSAQYSLRDLHRIDEIARSHLKK
ncbi:hypothetical protein MN116_004368 [Schistosoma mekongi]|uniref:NADH dehydrogenase [ubiquinone] 1 alpha subcomplex assembly factor 5 n=1 Tax=Schistosoma mekongi TaxID=38744 RepID=A0AAE1ZFR1_SCHME|nr:hypothetical protein MN116_004368 [Schistosoma mekongi]